MHIRHVDLNLIAVFDAIMTEGSLSRAGERLGMSQSAVSHALARLRSVTGDELFVRTGRGVRPTAHAVALAAPLRSAVDLVQRAFAESRRGVPPFETSRTFVIDLPVGFDLLFVPPLLDAVATLGIEGNFHVHADRAGDLASSLRYGETELALDVEAVDAKGLICEPLYQDDFMVLARKGDGDRRPALDADRYLEARHVTLRWTRSPKGSPVDQRLDALGVERRVALAMPTLAGCASAVACSDLLFTIHRRIANALAVRFGLALHPMPIAVAPVTLFQIWHERSQKDAGHMWLRESFSAIAAKL